MNLNSKPVSPKLHAILDYALVGSLFVLPSLLKMNKKAVKVYVAEAAVLLPYVALTRQPLAIKDVIPFKTHGKVDLFNVAQFAIQSFMPAFKNRRKELLFNIAFTAIAGATVLLTDWKSGK
ncbi:hypothetical protein [Mucilaginibacter aquatilis]|uniref:Uncharacterized protein n=1 Tax=Mucilaginibacter aquatilis TaxID=1517760 RepID=A0A6I4IQ15_9SPHI|nr:hypothetical protein [Mucilaginibacter aquatilis]MVN90294.1 hypothetical protein [Mucilaginibacter aquatilis]